MARLLERLLAVTMAGRVLVPINFRLNPIKIVYIVENSGASVLLMDPELDPASAPTNPISSRAAGDLYVVLIVPILSASGGCVRDSRLLPLVERE